MFSLKTLRILITLPNAHFRIMHSNDPCKTFPLPPYSTTIGFLANILGEKTIINTMLEETFALGILANYAYTTREYTWLRNLGASAHRRRFVSNTNRNWQGLPEHQGGQSPITIEVLNQVQVYIYLYHPNPLVLKELQQNISAPEKWFSHLHLGRAEDWAIVESADFIELSITDDIKHFRQADTYFQWMPEPEHSFGMDTPIKPEEYRELYEKVQGNAVLVTSTYALKEVIQDNKPITIRNFKHIPAQLCCCPIPFLKSFTLPSLLTDKQIGAPVYMTLIKN